MVKGKRISIFGMGEIGLPNPTGSIMRRLDDGKVAPSGKPGNMYGFLAATDTERERNLRAIKAWLGEGVWNHNRWTVRDNIPGITKEQLDKVKAKF